MVYVLRDSAALKIGQVLEQKSRKQKYLNRKSKIFV